MLRKSILHTCLRSDSLKIRSLSLLDGKMLMPRLLVSAALTVVAAACASDEPIAPSFNGMRELSSLPSLQRSASFKLQDGRDAVRVPFKVSGEGIGTGAEAQPPCDDGFTPTGNVAHGTGTHLGRFTSIHRQCVNFQTLEFRDGTVTYHAANGDQLHATFEGFLSPSGEAGVLSFDNPAHAAGGTGRFEGAEGVFRAWGLVNLNDNTFELNVDGHLVLPK